MSEEQKQALLNLINKCEKVGHTGNIQLNWFKGQVGTVQVLTSYKLDALVENFADAVK